MKLKFIDIYIKVKKKWIFQKSFLNYWLIGEYLKEKKVLFNFSFWIISSFAVMPIKGWKSKSFFVVKGFVEHFNNYQIFDKSIDS
jgi:hypothetical protein